MQGAYEANVSATVLFGNMDMAAPSFNLSKAGDNGRCWCPRAGGIGWGLGVGWGVWEGGWSKTGWTERGGGRADAEKRGWEEGTLWGMISLSLPLCLALFLSSNIHHLPLFLTFPLHPPPLTRIRAARGALGQSSV